MLKTTDNNCGNCFINEKNLADFQQIANLKVSNIDTHSNLLVFTNKQEKLEQDYIFTLKENKLTTNNIMGFIGLNDSQLTIQSRFAKNDQDFFLHYLLQKVFSINLFDLKHRTSKENIFDFLIFLFPYFLKKALQQGIYKEYTRNQYNNANVKGAITINHHIKKNIPFNGKIAYQVREHQFDNKVTQLIRHTIEFIRKQKGLSSILDHKDSRKIIEITPTYEENKRRTIIKQNTRPIRHPYFSAYTPLQKICLQILRYQGLKYGNEKDKIYGLLFDGAWLWEEYIYKILKDCGFKHPRNDFSKGGIYLFQTPKSYKRYPDCYKEKIVVDAKYKRLENKQIERNDMHQIISYMYILQSEIGGFLYPIESKNLQNITIGKLNGYSGNVKKWGFPIPQNAEDFPTFCKLMETYENQLKEQFNEEQ